LVHRTGFV